MSTTAGVGTQEYVAINPTAIAALFLGCATVLVVLGNILFLIPVVGTVCALIALVQIRRSNQTQTGIGLALLGLLLSAGIGAGRLGYQTIKRSRAVADERQIAQVVDALGKEASADDYRDAYQLFDDRFRERIDYATFETAFRGFHNIGPGNGVTSIKWNGEPMRFEDAVDSDVAYADAMTLFQLQPGTEPGRVLMEFEKSGGKWRIHDIPNIFPKKTQ